MPAADDVGMLIVYHNLRLPCSHQNPDSGMTQANCAAILRCSACSGS
jgi:hypothetical protein